MTALFGKTKKDKVKDSQDNKEVKDIVVEESDKKTETDKSASESFSGISGAGTHKVLGGFYVSEKSSIGNAVNQYIFRVFKDANKSEVKKEVSKLFKVEVKSVKILNMPKKRRDFGKHPGFKTGFKKAVVVLKEGFTIGQAKP